MLMPDTKINANQTIVINSVCLNQVDKLSNKIGKSITVLKNILNIIFYF